MKTNDRTPKMIRLSKARYILYFGVLGWGLLTALLFTGWNLYTKKELSTAELVVPFITFPLGGLLWGAAMWSMMNPAARSEPDN